MSKICLVLTAPTIEENLRIINRNRLLIDMVELRTDLLNKDQYDYIAAFPSRIDIPVILTCRKPVDGGKWDGEESDRLNGLSEWLDGDFSYIDLEMDLTVPALVEKAARRGVGIIRSFHDFSGVPADLYEKMTSGDHEGVLVKGAVYPRSSEDLYRLIAVSLRLKNQKPFSYILLGMGEFGFPTRILAEKLGSFLTFCSDRAVQSGAPGHCSAGDLSDIYNFRNITASTSINSIIGNPVSQSRSPQIHNRGYRENKIDAVYVPFLTDSLQWFMKTAELLGIGGSSVTVPFKSDIIPLLSSPDESVRKIGACNTIYIDESKGWKGTNTDTWGLIKPLLDFMETETLTGRKAAVIGAGGAARAAVYALQDKGAEVAVFNRTLSRGEELADHFGCGAYKLDKTSIEKLVEYSSVIVQTTNAGMAPLENINPLDFYSFSGTEVVYDIIYKPEKTILLKKAEEAGCRILSGYRMLEEQAYLQFRLFTGRDYE